MMSAQTTENFWKVIENFCWPETKPVSYRLYHDDQGRPLFYTMEDLPGTYIEVDQPTYVSSPGNVRVRDGRLEMQKSAVSVMKLQPHPEQGICCHTRDICVVVDLDNKHRYWCKAINEIN